VSSLGLAGLDAVLDGPGTQVGAMSVDDAAAGAIGRPGPAFAVTV
jgi:hypothetical protein